MNIVHFIILLSFFCAENNNNSGLHRCARMPQTRRDVFHIIPPPHCAITPARRRSQLIYRRRCSFHLVKKKRKIINKYARQKMIIIFNLPLGAGGRPRRRSCDVSYNNNNNMCRYAVT